MIKTSLYNQWSGPWANRILTPSNFLFANYGCFIDALTMGLPNWAILRDDGTPLDPGEVLTKLIAKNALNSDGFLTYDGVMRTFPQLYYHDRVYTTNDPSSNHSEMNADIAVRKVKKLLDHGQPTILAVDNADNDGYPDHAVLAYDYILGSDGKISDFFINDPDGGRAIKFTEKYGPPLTKLYGYVAIIGPPLEYPSQSTDADDGTSIWKSAEIKKGHNVQTYSRELIDSFLSV